jgi:hypothetical protein
MKREIPVESYTRLAATFPKALTLIEQCRAGVIDAETIEDYLALGWLRWDGCWLSATVEGERVRALPSFRPMPAVAAMTE